MLRSAMRSLNSSDLMARSWRLPTTVNLLLPPEVGSQTHPHSSTFTLIDPRYFRHKHFCFPGIRNRLTSCPRDQGRQRLGSLWRERRCRSQSLIPQSYHISPTNIDIDPHLGRSASCRSQTRKVHPPRSTQPLPSSRESQCPRFGRLQRHSNHPGSQPPSIPSLSPVRPANSLPPRAPARPSRARSRADPRHRFRHSQHRSPHPPRRTLSPFLRQLPRPHYPRPQHVQPRLRSRSCSRLELRLWQQRPDADDLCQSL